MYPIVLNCTDEELIRHLEEKHPADLALKFTANHRELSSRRAWHVFHDFWLHRAAPGGADHEHESYMWTGWERETVRLPSGWKQMTRCTCLQPPTHQSDCPGKQGVVVLGEDHGGPSARQRIWIRLDSHMDGLMGKSDFDLKYAAVPKAEAAMLAWCLAAMDNPADPDVDAIRKEAVKRWKERQNV